MTHSSSPLQIHLIEGDHWWVSLMRCKCLCLHVCQIFTYTYIVISGSRNSINTNMLEVIVKLRMTKWSVSSYFWCWPDPWLGKCSDLGELLLKNRNILLEAGKSDKEAEAITRFGIRAVFLENGMFWNNLNSWRLKLNLNNNNDIIEHIS